MRIIQIRHMPNATQFTLALKKQYLCNQVEGAYDRGIELMAIE